MSASLRSHRAEPRDAGGRLLGAPTHLGQELAPAGVQLGHHVGAVVHRDLGTRLEDGADVRVVRVAVLAFLREDRDAFVGHERRRDIVLRRERIRRAERDARAAVAQHEHQVRGLRGDVQARADAQIDERTLFRESLADLGENGHLARGPGDAASARLRETEVGDVVLGRPSGDGHYFLSFRAPIRRSQAARRTAGPSMYGACVK